MICRILYSAICVKLSYQSLRIVLHLQLLCVLRVLMFPWFGLICLMLICKSLSIMHFLQIVSFFMNIVILDRQNCFNHISLIGYPIRKFLIIRIPFCWLICDYLFDLGNRITCLIGFSDPQGNDLRKDASMPVCMKYDMPFVTSFVSSDIQVVVIQQTMLEGHSKTLCVRPSPLSLSLPSSSIYPQHYS